MLGGRTVIMAGVTMRADLQRKVERSADGGEGGEKAVSATAITIGRYAADPPEHLPFHLLSNHRGTIVSTNCTIRPPMRMSRGQMTFYPLKIGDGLIGPLIESCRAELSLDHAVVHPRCNRLSE